MAEARKCDRCKECYDPANMSGMSCYFENPVFQTSSDVRQGVVGDLLVDGLPDTRVDLCPKCAREFSLFMNKNDDIPKEDEDKNKNEKDDIDLDDILRRVFNAPFKDSGKSRK